MASERLSPRIAAKENATHSIPGAINERSTLLGSKAKLNIARTRTPNMSMELTDSLLRISITMSLKMIAVIGFIGRPPHECKQHKRHAQPGLWQHPRRRSLPDQGCRHPWLSATPVPDHPCSK